MKFAGVQRRSFYFPAASLLIYIVLVQWSLPDLCRSEDLVQTLLGRVESSDADAEAENEDYEIWTPFMTRRHLLTLVPQEDDDQNPEEATENGDEEDEESLDEEFLFPEFEGRVFHGDLVQSSEHYPFMCYIMYGTLSVAPEPQRGASLPFAQNFWTGEQVNPNAKTKVASGKMTWNLLCGCYIMGQSHVGTAAHCVPEMEDLTRQHRLLEVWTGATSIGRVPKMQYRYKLRKVQTRNFKPEENYRNDMAIVTLGRSLKYEPRVQRICMGMGQYDQQPVTLLGCGYSDCRHVSTKLREAHGVARDYHHCGDMKGLHEDQLCTVLHSREKQMADQSPGDSGGPLFCRKNGTYVLVGSVSYNLVDKRSKCPMAGHPSIFSRVGAQREFIETTVRDACYDDGED